jgi:Spy/CpxP family protein refolding chaperone
MKYQTFSEWFGSKTKKAKEEMAEIRKALATLLPPEQREKLVARYKELLAQGYGDNNVDTDLLNAPLSHWW